MRLKPLPDTHCLECNKVVPETTRKGYLIYFCDECLDLPKKENEDVSNKEQINPVG